MKIRRLGWDGLQVTDRGGRSLVIDYVRDSSTLLHEHWTGGSSVRLSDGKAVAALVTHLHEDHADVAAIESAVGSSGLVLRPEPFEGSAAERVFTAKQEADLAASSLAVRTVRPWQHLELGPFTVTAVPAVDGLGDPQVSWVVEADGKRLLHGGDTAFHGYWWLVAGRVGPIDVAALPVNGAVVDVPHLQPPSALPACMGPREAVQAAISLQAAILLPLHYGISGATGYLEHPDPLAHVAARAAEAGLRAVMLEPGEALDLSDRQR